MRYLSTRGQVGNLSFKETVMMGLADDGGLLLPAQIPSVKEHLESWRGASFQELSLALLLPYVAGELPKETLWQLIQRSYASFRHPEITPVLSVGGVHILELFHGPTFAFKDVALQLLGNLFEALLAERGHPMTVIGATSGDTGSAAIAGLRGKQGVHVFMLHPKGRVSPMQERQMTTILDANIHNIAVEGTFDDGQNIVKALFNQLEFKRRYHLGAINSINWARVMAQIVYYFYAYFRVQPKVGQPVDFSVPTGNFGDVLAGYYAQQMGLPIRHLIVATNQNDILHRFFSRGTYHQSEVVPSCSPSMDIQISSNFERFLYYLAGEQTQTVREWMLNFQKTGQLTLTGELLQKAQKAMKSAAVSEVETLSTIRDYSQKYGYLLDPHTAVGVKASEGFRDEVPMICLATAHPAKFAEAVQKATGKAPTLPLELEALENLPTRCQTLPATPEAIQHFMIQKLG